MKKHLCINKRTHFSIVVLILLLLLGSSELRAQQSNRVLFLGNSYTGVNNLPQIIADIAQSVGDTLIFDSHTPGGYQLIDHSLTTTSQNKIMAGGWDYIVLQGQSQEPITNPSEFGNGAAALYNQIRQYNPCTTIMPYMTWGRKNGDASNCLSFPAMCTYQGMDTTLRNKYLDLTSNVNGEVSPVSVVWNYIRQNHPSIELYQPDESHPSTAGSYAAACCFYAAIFKKDPTLITYDFGLNTTDASIIKNVAKTVVYDNLNSWDYKKLPIANISYNIGAGINEVHFSPGHTGLIRQNYLWDFGDGDTSTSFTPTHSYLSDGTYTVTLTTTNCDLQGTYSSIMDTVIQFCSHTPSIYTSNPWLCKNDTLWTQPADAYQWFANGVLLPETNQYLANYSLYSLSGFSVISSVSGCSELSEVYSESPKWSGYYFDALGDPCAGDTVAFAVLHVNGFLSGSEVIQWYKNDTLLPLMNNEDTLMITEGGKYEVIVIDPTSDCPMDTTTTFQTYNCATVGIENNTNQSSYWYVFPNPAQETITIRFTKNVDGEQIHIFNVNGGLVKEKDVSDNTIINISDLESGVYFIELKNTEQPVLKFIKQ